MATRVETMRPMVVFVWTARPALAFHPSPVHPRRHPTSYVRSYATNKNKHTNPYDRRDDVGRQMRGFQSSLFKDTIEVGDMVTCKLPNPDLGIYENISYELQSIYAQSFDDETQSVVKLPLNGLDEVIPAGSTLYITLFSPNIHKEAVVVSPQEVGLSSVKNELGDAAWLAVPGFFWVFVASSLYHSYHEKTGGSVLDAFWGR